MSPGTHPPVLTRAAMAEAGRPMPAAPIRIAHLGLGAFTRAHQAWYTARASDADRWGIAAFAGRSPGLANRLATQDGLFTLVERGAESDRFEIVGSIVEARPGNDVERLVDVIAAADLRVVTLTVTEAGYRLGADGTPDLDDPALAADMELLRSAARTGVLGSVRPTTIPSRLLVGLERRRRAREGGLTVVPCDNFPDNGPILRRALMHLASEFAPGLAAWIRDEVAFVSTSVDRITPSVDDSLKDTVAEATGWADEAPVAAEPFADWTLAGEFPRGRPAWEEAGARFVDEIGPYESRKLWMLNGAHSLLAYLGRLRGHATVADAIEDRECRAAVESWWQESGRHLPSALGPDDYARALLARFGNSRIEHRLEQISSDGLTKLGLRIVPVARLERAAGRPATASAVALGAWIAAVRAGLPMAESRRTELDRADGSTRGMLGSLAADLAADQAYCALVDDIADRFRTVLQR